MLLKYSDLSELENSIKLDDLSKYAIKNIVKSMPELQAAGRKHLLNDAKEDAYSHFFRYMTLLDLVVKSTDYNRTPEVFKKDLNDAPFVFRKLEYLRSELDSIYKSKQMVMSLNKIDADSEDSDDEDMAMNTQEVDDDFLDNPAICLNNIHWIGIDRLLECIKVSRNKYSYMIYDTRTVEEFNKSHLQARDLNFTNIPMETLPNGTSAAMMESLLSGDAKEKWIMRGSYQFVLLLGESDNPEAITPSVSRLHDIITKWDPNTNYFHRPIILEGGYISIGFTYPIYCTAAVSSSPKAAAIPSLEDIQYPTNILDMDPTISSSTSDPPVRKPCTSKSVPHFDRSKKPGCSSTSKIDDDDVDEDDDEEDDVDDQEPSSSYSVPMKSNRIPPARHMETRSFSNSFRATFETPNKPHTRSADQQRGTKSFMSLPEYDRSKKPKMAKPAVDHTRYEPTRRAGRDLLPGCTGLQNSSNYCYVNSIIQVLFHMNDLRDYLLDGTYLNHLDRQSKTRGAVCEELAAMCQVYYSGLYSTISSKNIKRVIGSVNPRFANDTQEDCHEFFMVLLHYLHEELSYHVAIPDNAREPEIKFIEYMNNLDSFINKKFFGQSETRVRCHQCNYISSTYTPFGCLTIEIVGSTLEECISEHYREEEVEDFRCERCSVKGKVTKKTYIYRTPHYLTIHLKRFKGAGLRCYNKKLDRLGFPMHLSLPRIANNCPEVAEYRLLGICTHSGNLDCGHYKTYINMESSESWVLYDDARVVKLDSLISHIRTITKDVYMLFYRSI